MKLEILKKHLEEVVQTVSRVSNKNLSLPVLGCVLISANSGHVTLKATNLDVSVEVEVKAKIITEGVVAVPAQIFSQTISTTTDEKISLEVVDGNVVIKTKNGEVVLNSVDASDFPSLPFVKDGEGVVFTLQVREFIRAIKATIFAASNSGIRAELASVFMGVFGGILTAAATDSFRLAEIKIPTNTKQNTDPILIPVRNIQDILRVVSTSDTIEVRVGENQATYLAGGNYITTRIIDGAFPEYQKIIPQSFISTATFLTQDILNALKKSSVFVDQTGQVEFVLNINNKTFTINTSNSQLGNSHEEVDGVFEGEDITLYFNARYIIDALSAASSDSVCFKFSGHGKPLIINEVPDRGFMYLVMPMNK